MSNNVNIMSWRTWKRKNIPQIYSCCDGTKGWAKETVQPTLTMYGFKIIASTADYCFSTKPKQWALEEAEYYLERQGEKKECEFVYFESRGNNGYMNYRAVFVKKIEQKAIKG